VSAINCVRKLGKHSLNLCVLTLKERECFRDDLINQSFQSCRRNFNCKR